MNKTISVCTATLCLLAGFLATPASAMGLSMGSSQSHKKDTYTTNRPWGNLQASTPAPQYQPPQPALPGGYYLGGAPESGWYTAPLPASYATGNSIPAIEAEVSDSIFYEQMNSIYTVRVISDGNLSVLNRVSPRSEAALLEPIDGPVTTTRSNGYNRPAQIVNTYRYRLNPLHAGEVVVPSIRFTGTHAAIPPMHQPASEFTIATDPMTLQVRPADPSVQPWLPLHELRLQASMQQDGIRKAGQPVTLTVEMTAQGAQGNQLPSVADQIKSPLFRVYRDATTIKSGISPNGRHLTGSRKETFTLIPLEDGWVRLPDINVAWWDVERQQASLAGMPPSEANAGTSARAANVSGENTSRFTLLFWLPMAIALALIAGYVLGAWHRTRSLLKLSGTWLSAMGLQALERGRHIGSRISPTRHLQRVRMSLALLMPRAVKIWACTRCLAAEDNPHAWCAEFKSRICQHLDIAGHSPLTSIAEKLIAASPRAEPGRLRELAHSLEGAMYGGRALDFKVWKQDLQQQLRPRLLRRSRIRSLRTTNRLPALNPYSA